MSILLGAARLLSAHPEAWNGTIIALFQPAEETGDGAKGTVDDGLLDRIPKPDVALAQYVLPGESGRIAAGRVHDDIPVNHSPLFLPVIQPTLRTGTEAIVTGTLSFLAD